jgi:hypothetical protein
VRFVAHKPRALAGALLGGVAALAFGGALMGAEPAGKPAPHLRRLSEAQYRQTIADIFGGDIKVAGRFEPDMRVEGLLAAGAGSVSVTPSGMEQYEEIARGVAVQVVDPVHRDRLVGCQPAAADPAGEACARTFFTRVGRKLYRRPLGPSELQLAVSNTLSSARTLGDFHAGLAASLTGLLTAPEFLFQVERPARGGKSLDGWSKAARLSYFLWNTTPDDELLSAAERGELDTAQGLARQVDRLIASPRFETGARAFFQDYLQLDDLESVSKDPLIYPAFTAPILADSREQTLRTLMDHLIRERGDYREVFTRRKVAINRNLGALYRVPVAASGWTTHEFPESDPRGGLVTQISFLAQHSHPGRTSPTLRGKAIREILMCETVPTPPANVNFAVVQDVSNPQFKTTRQRLQAHLDDEECASCHKLTDPAGLALENFDGAGQFRLRENGETIDVSGSLGKKLTFEDARGLGRALRDSPETTACLVKSVFRYGLGRNLRVEEEMRLSGLNAAFAAQGHRFPDLARTIATDPAFYAPYRSAGPFRVAARPAERKGALQ